MTDGHERPGFEISPDDALTLYAAAVVRRTELAAELVRLGIDEEADEEAVARLRPIIFDSFMAARDGKEYLQYVWERIANRVMREVGYPAKMPGLVEIADAYCAALNEESLTVQDEDRAPDDPEVLEGARRLHEAISAEMRRTEDAAATARRIQAARASLAATYSPISADWEEDPDAVTPYQFPTLGASPEQLRAAYARLGARFELDERGRITLRLVLDLGAPPLHLDGTHTATSTGSSMRGG